jgi:membrane fusion protein (multidrug efflux system)
MIERRAIFLLILSMLFLVSCGAKDKQAQLAKLEKQRDEITIKINKLRAEISNNKEGLNSNNKKIVHVTITEVKPEVFKHYISVQGTIESDKNILIPSQSAGIIKRIYVDKGDTVAKGQLLAELDGSVLESNIAEIKNSLELATTIFERQQRLWNKNIGTEIEYLQAKNNKENSEKKLQTLNEQYKLTKITAPIDGTVDEVIIKEGEAAAAGMSAIRIVQLSNLKIIAALSENYITQIKKGDLVDVELPVLGKQLKLKIDAVSQVINPDNRTFDIEIKIPAYEKGVKPNMLAVLTINDYINYNALTIPQKVVQKTGEKQFLFAALSENGKWYAQKRNVETGEYYGDKIEVLNGLSQGDYVVTLGFQNLADGQMIAVDMNNGLINKLKEMGSR